MAEKKKGKKRKEEYVLPGKELEDKPIKEEYKIAKWLRKNVPIKKTKFLNHNVEYFTGSRAIDGLLDSQWAQGDDPFFKSREDIVEFLHVMLEHKFFHRARKVPVSEEELRARKKSKKAANSDDDTKKKKEKEKAKDSTLTKRDEKKEKEKITDAESSVVESSHKPGEGEVVKEKRKRKIRLEMHNAQCFVDSLDAYVWIYDPIPFHYWIIGSLLVLASIGLSLFPLWPPSVRLGVYYLSIVAAGFLVFIIFLAFLRVVIFSLVWAITFGRHHIWIFPNLTEDVGFFASFWPLYTYTYNGPDSDNEANSKGKNKGKKKKKDKDSDNEEEDDQDQEIKEEENTLNENENENDLTKKPTDEDMAVETMGVSESESESSQRSSTGKDFEMVEREDLET